MPDEDRPREPGGADETGDLDWSADGSASTDAAKPTLGGLGIGAPDATPAAAAPLAPKPDAASAAPAPERPTEPVSASVAIPTTVPTMPAVKPTDASHVSPGGIHIELFGRTDVGLVREHNEDNFLVADLTRGKRGVDVDVCRHEIGQGGTLLVVCDGMGGAAAGEVASQMAVDTIHQILGTGGVPPDHDALARRLVAAVEEAGRRIFASAKADRTRRGMGTTATAAALVDSTLFIAQVGDSRAYVVRGGKVGLVTRDQSLVNQLIEAGQLTEAEAESFEHSNIILQALGTSPDVQVDLTYVPLRRGDRLLLCSDGLSGLVPAEILREVLEEVRDPSAACARLIEMANAGGGHDNITVIVATFDGTSLELPRESEPPTFARYELPPAPEPAAEPPPKEGPPVAEGEAPYRTTSAEEADAAETPSEPPIRRTSAGGGRIAIALAVLVVTGLAAYLFLSGDALTAGAPESASPTPASVSPRTAATAQPLPDLRQRCLFTSMPGADLLVDGRPLARFDDTGKVTLHLDAGFHDVEVRDGTTRIAGERVDVRMGGENQFELQPPSVPDGTEGEIKPPTEGQSVADGEVAPRRRRKSSGEATAEPHPRRDAGGSRPPRGSGDDSPIAPNPFD